MTCYWYTVCPFCHQGRLLIEHDKTNNSLYLRCEECESGWRDPESINDISARFLALDEEFESDCATPQEIAAAGWSKYRVHSFEK